MNRFNFYIPLQKSTGNEQELIGIASTTSIDRDGERMSTEALKQMKEDIERVGVNLFGNHEHQWENTLGAVRSAELIGDSLRVNVTLDDPTTNPKVPALMNKLARGIKLGLSVGGKVLREKSEMNRDTGNRVKVIDAVKLYEISVVGIPSNADSYLTLPMAINKSAKEIPDSCPLCWVTMKGATCPCCLYTDEDVIVRGDMVIDREE